MARRTAPRHEWANEPDRLLFHNSPYDIWAKLNWEANEFELHRTSEPPIDVDGMVFLLQNACISVVSVVEWLRLEIKQNARRQKGDFALEAFEREVDLFLPHLKLARAVANTFKHREYRDEGWGTAEVRLMTVFRPDQRTRLDAALGTKEFEALYAEEAAEADYRITFVRDGGPDEVDAAEFVLSLAHGALRLLDATWNDQERFRIANRRE